MRSRNSIKNIYISILTQVIITILGFISRKVFLDNLGTEYLGVNGLLTNVLSMLSLVEGGIGTSIVYNLYSPLAKKEEDKIIALVQLYKKIYGFLSIVIFMLSFALYPFLGMFIKEKDSLSNLGVIYFIFVLKNVISYLNAHKWSLINADQKGYVIAKYNLLFNIITTLSKIIVLVTTKNYVLFLLIELLVFAIQNIWNGKIVNKRYRYIITNKKYKVDEKVKENLIINVKAIFLHNIGTYCIFGTDNLLISSFISITAVGIYSNYTMIISQMSSFFTPILNGVGESVGNLIATESKEKSYRIFKVLYLVNFWIYSVCTIFLYNLLEPFIEWWLGHGLLIDRLSFIVILINFYLSGMRSSILTYKMKAGRFVEDKYMPILEAIINLISSILLVKWLGLAGIFVGTTISTILIPFWIQPRIVYNKVFEKASVEYFKKYLYFVLLTLLVGGVTTLLCISLNLENNFGGLVSKGLICAIVPNVIYVIIFFKKEEFQYIWSLLINQLYRVKGKLIKVNN